MYIWRYGYDAYWAICQGCLLIKVTVNNVTFVLPPFGGINEELPKIIDALRENFQGKPFEIHGIYDSTLERLKKFAPEIVADYTLDRNNCDYVYLRDDLANLSGRKFHGPKNHVNRFIKDHPDYTYEPITPANLEECLAYGRKWCEERANTDESIMYEDEAIEEAFKGFAALKLRGGLIRYDGNVQAFSFGEKMVGSDMAVIHVEKADPQVNGLFNIINRDFVRNAWPDVKYINREEDMGKPGLRRAKESLCPAFLINKYNIIVK